MQRARLRRHNGPKSKVRRGAAVVEMALTVPVFLLILLGIFEFGRGMMVGNLVTSAARAGARRAILELASNTDVEQTVRTFCQETLGMSGGDVNVAITVDTAPGNDPAGNEVGLAQSGDRCRVSVSVPFDKVSYMAPKWLSGKSVTGQCSMEKE